MCGIFAILNNYGIYRDDVITKSFYKGIGRGPETSSINISHDGNRCIGFHRLAINGLNSNSDQPIIHNKITLICNGEIYNYKELFRMMNVVPKTDSDCEVIVHLYEAYGIEQTLTMLDGVFAFILIDDRGNNSKLYASRDPYGVRPLYKLSPSFRSHRYNYINERIRNNFVYGFASEMKCLHAFCLLKRHINRLEQFMPGTYTEMVFDKSYRQEKISWKLVSENNRYHTTGFKSYMFIDPKHPQYMKTTLEGIRKHLMDAVKKRVLVTDRPIACLLSGGLDSSLITALVNDIHKENSKKPLETYSIGLEGSDDLKYARIVADYLGTKHTEVVLTEEEFLIAIPEVISTIESYDTTTVRASIGNYLIAKYISNHSEAKVIFNGDGSDELAGGYLYMHEAPNMIEFDKECKRLLKDIYMYDVLRSDKCISSNGLEPRTPFLDRSWVQFYLSIHPELRYHKGNGQCEKYLIRKAFSKEEYLTMNLRPLLPNSVLWRTKEAFSDGVSKTTRSLYEIIQEHSEKTINTEDYFINKVNKIKRQKHNIPDTCEKIYYRGIFDDIYPGMAKLLPYFWMPKYVNTTDSSARTLTQYTELQSGSQTVSQSEGTDADISWENSTSL